MADAYKVNVKELNMAHLSENPENATKVDDLDKLTFLMKENIRGRLQNENTDSNFGHHSTG